MFSTDDDVLELIAAKKSGYRPIICKESGVNGDAVFSNKLRYLGNVVSDGVNVPTWKYLYGRIEYNKYGIRNTN